MTSFSGSCGAAALNSSYYTPQLRDRFDLPMPPPPEPKPQQVSSPKVKAENAVKLDVVT